MAAERFAVLPLGVQLLRAVPDLAHELVAELVGALQAALQALRADARSDLLVETVLHGLELAPGLLQLRLAARPRAARQGVRDHAEVDAADVVGLDIETLALDLLILALALALHLGAPHLRILPPGCVEDVVDQVDGHGAVVLAEFVKILVGGHVEGRHRAVDEQDEVHAARHRVVERTGEVDAVAVEAGHVREEDLAAFRSAEHLARRRGDGGDDGIVLAVVGRGDVVLDVLVAERVGLLGKVLAQLGIVVDDAAQLVDDQVQVLLLAGLVLGGIDLDRRLRIRLHAGDDGGPEGALQLVGGTDVAVGQQVDQRGLAGLDRSDHQHDERAVPVLHRAAPQPLQPRGDLLVGREPGLISLAQAPQQGRDGVEFLFVRVCHSHFKFCKIEKMG